MTAFQKRIYEQCLAHDKCVLTPDEFHAAFPRQGEELADSIHKFFLESSMRPSGISLNFISPGTFTISNRDTGIPWQHLAKSKNRVINNSSPECFR